MSEPLRIFIVEDEALILMQIEMILEDNGYIVSGTAMTAREAIEMLQETRADLVLIDVRLGDGSSGLDVASAARDFGGISTAFMTANDQELTGELNGAMAVIAKPFTPRLLADALIYLEHCVRKLPSIDPVPRGMRIAPDYLASFAEMQT